MAQTEEGLEVTISVRVSKAVKEVMETLCNIEAGGKLMKVDTLGSLARECLLRGLKQILEEKGMVKSGE